MQAIFQGQRKKGRAWKKQVEEERTKVGLSGDGGTPCRSQRIVGASRNVVTLRCI